MVSRSKSIRKRSPKVTKRSPRRTYKRSKCRTYLQDKIRININEYKQGRYKSRNQAIAVSYSQVKKKKPMCKKILSRKRQ
jgi:hypothetical protein